MIPIPVPADGQLKCLTPAEGSTPNEPHHNWQVRFLRHAHISSPTRNDNRADGGRAKDGTYSLIDYLDHEGDGRVPAHHGGDLLRGGGRPVRQDSCLGFFGDEPDYSENNTSTNSIRPGSAGVPWTPTLLEQFKAQKGYDLTA